MSQQPIDQLIQIRKDKLKAIREMGIDPYPATANRTQTVAQALALQDQEVTIAGRIRSLRSHGNLWFADLEDQSGKMQVMLRKQDLGEQFQLIKKLDVGDFVSINGKVFTTQAGEVTVQTHAITILTKSLYPLPDQWYGLKDVEERYRKRYVDMILNPDVKQKILLRSKVMNAIRQFLLSKEFVEVETPMLEMNASGALAQPFQTHIKAYDMDLYLRICMGELWQKKLMIGGLEKTFEMGRAFRNEGVDREHNPEFTMMEYYWAYADYQLNMQLQEQLIAYVVEAALGKSTVSLGDHTLDFTPPYPRKTIRELILEKTQIDIDLHTDAQALGKVMTQYRFTVDAHWGRGHLIDEFYKEYVRPYLTGPIFVTHHPKDLKPLAKEDPDYPGYTQSFQLLVNGFEVSNNYSELNDPMDQRERFANQKQLADHGDDETMSSDLEFVEALEYGMPPTTGTGIGIDRLVALLANAHHIREVIAFPLMKPKNNAMRII